MRITAYEQHQHVELRHALSRTPRELPTRYLYDARGADLFEQILELPEYYQARTERALLHTHADALVDGLGARALIELGVGSGEKTHVLLGALSRQPGSSEVVVQDVNAATAARAALWLDECFPHVRVRGASGDFLGALPAPPAPGPKLWALLGATFGNLTIHDGLTLLRRIARVADPGDGVLLGLDLAHDRPALLRAYDDSRGVTAAFNLNALRHVNRAAEADFPVASFRHSADFDEARSRIEMRLVAERSMTVSVRRCGLRLRLSAGDSLRTEISEKHTRQSLIARAAMAGFWLQRFLTDERERYALALLRPALPASAPIP